MLRVFKFFIKHVLVNLPVELLLDISHASEVRLGTRALLWRVLRLELLREVVQGLNRLKVINTVRNDTYDMHAYWN